MHNIMRLQQKFFLLLILGFLASCTMVDKQEYLMSPESMDGKAEKAEEWYQSTGDGIYKLGKPYKVNGVWYFPTENMKYDEIGYAGTYNADFDNQRTTNGEIYSKNRLTASHKTLPLPSIVRVTNLANNISVILRINDRGPFSNERLIDISDRAAKMLEFDESGTARVRVEILPEESKKSANLLVLEKKDNDIPLAVPTSTQLPTATDGSSPQPPETVVVKTSTTDPMLGSTQQAPTTKENNATPDTNEAEISTLSSDRITAMARMLGNVPTTQQNVTPTNATESSMQASADTAEEASSIAPPMMSAPVQSLKGGPYYIQAGTFGIKQNAINLSKKLSNIAPISITPIAKGTKKLNQVYAGPFNSKEDAEKILSYIKQGLGISDARLLKK